VLQIREAERERKGPKGREAASEGLAPEETSVQRILSQGCIAGPAGGRFFTEDNV